jgi:putative inorganic carbon (HCO3(-)) transporter
MSFYLFLIFIISYFLHFPDRLPFLATIRFDFTLGLLILISLFIEGRFRQTVRANTTSKYLFFFMAYILLSLPFVTWPGSVLRYHLPYWGKAAALFVFFVGSVQTTAQLRLIVFVFLGCQAFRIVEPMVLHITTGYWGDVAYSTVAGGFYALDRLSGAPHDIVNPNQLAWVAVSTVPFLYYLFWQGGRQLRILFLAVSPILVACLLLTGSRSGLLCFILVFSALIYHSKKRLSSLFTVALVVVPVLIFSIATLSDDMKVRYLSIVDRAQVGGDTATARLNALYKQLETISRNPFFGNGLGTSREVNWNVGEGAHKLLTTCILKLCKKLESLGSYYFRSTS